MVKKAQIILDITHISYIFLYVIKAVKVQKQYQ